MPTERADRLRTSQFRSGDYNQQDIGVTVGTDDIAWLVWLEDWARNGPPDRPEPLMELCVTQAFRLEDGAWRPVHRHADELVKKRELR